MLWIDDMNMMTRDDVVMIKKIKKFKIVQNWSNIISKGILHHLAKFPISWPSFTVILGDFQKLEQGMTIFGTR